MKGGETLGDKQRLIFRVSLALNALLIPLVIWGHFKMNYVNDQLFLKEVEYNLIELEDLITKQSHDNWTNANLVTTEFRNVLNSMGYGMRTNQTLTEDNSVILYKLYEKLKQYPHEQKDNHPVLTDQDKKNFEELQEILHDVGLGLNVKGSDDMESFINRAAELEKRIRAPLNHTD